MKKTKNKKKQLLLHHKQKNTLMESVNAIIQAYQKASKGVLNAQRYSDYAATYHSTSMEGSTLTSTQVTNLLDLGKTATNKAFWEHQMVVDHYEAMKFIAENAQQKKEITPQLISDIAALVMKSTGGQVNSAAGSFDTSKGEYRKCSVFSGARIFPSYQKVGTMVADLCAKLNKAMKNAKTTEEKLEIAFMAQFELVSIHPFADGNGRTSRLLMNYIQLYYGLPPGVVFKGDKIKYINKMEALRKSENPKPYVAFMMSQYKRFLKQETKHFLRK